MVSLAAPPSSVSPNQAQARAHFGKPQSRSRKDLASLGKVPRVIFDAPLFFALLARRARSDLRLVFDTRCMR